MNYWNDLTHHTDVADIWMAHPLVRAAINRRVSGEERVWPITALRRWLGERAPLATSVSIGCGAGSLERSLIDEGVVAHAVGIDLAENAIEEAAKQAGYRPLDYLVADARAFLRRNRGKFDAVFFHQSLHHFDRLDELMDDVAQALRTGGMLYLDEYVGPSRDEWSPLKLVRPNLAYRTLPASVRRPRIVRAPINREDPTEAIRSSGIMPAVERRFRIVERRDYGGNLLALLYPNLRRPDEGSAPEVFDAAVAKLLAMEERLLRRGVGSYCTVAVAEPRY